MLLKGYREEISRPACNNTFQSLHCVAHLDENISEVLPYLNAVLGGDTYIKDPPSATFKTQGKTYYRARNEGRRQRFESVSKLKSYLSRFRFD